MKWNGCRVVVTGADGFIGAHLTHELVRRGAIVTGLAQYNSFDHHGWLDELPGPVRSEITLTRCDIRDAHQMLSIVDGQEVVFHLAALIAIPFSYVAPETYVQTNVQGTLNLLSAARQAGVAKFIHTSTSEVYGTARFEPITEEHPLHAQSPYAASKIGADMLAESFARSFGLPTITLRPFNTYGPRQSERAVIGTIIRQALDPRVPAIRLGALSPTRDFNYVTDTVSAFLHAAGLGAIHHGQVFNAGTGRKVAIAEVVDLVRDIIGTDKTVITDEQRLRPGPSEVLTLIADASKLRTASGWTPTVTLEEGLEHTVDWWRGRLDRVRDSVEQIL